MFSTISVKQLEEMFEKHTDRAKDSKIGGRFAYVFLNHGSVREGGGGGVNFENTSCWGGLGGDDDDDDDK